MKLLVNVRLKYLAAVLSLVTLPFFALPSLAQATYSEVVEKSGLIELAQVIEQTQIDQTLPADIQKKLGRENSLAAALLVELNCIKLESINDGYADEGWQSCQPLQTLSLPELEPPTRLTNLLNSMLIAGIFEGYNVKLKTDMSNENTAPNLILYGHQNLNHAQQLINLLVLNGADFVYRLIPKTSAFKIREDWGNVGAGKTEGAVRYASEYDIQFIFATEEDKLMFMPLINKYAKRDAEHQQGLIAHAWWQPFYRRFEIESGYKQVKRVSFNSPLHTGSTLVLNENYDQVMLKVSSYLATHTQKLELKTEDVWVNPAFHRYLQGNFK